MRALGLAGGRRVVAMLQASFGDIWGQRSALAPRCWDTWLAGDGSGAGRPRAEAGKEAASLSELAARFNTAADGDWAAVAGRCDQTSGALRG